MNPEELFRGESETIEYKASVAPKSEAYMKTVIAFANGRGGQLLFGVQDVSGEALGLGRKAVFKYMDAVANAIASKCQPRIHPHIYLYEVDRKPIIIVDVPPGVETPYWMQNEGLSNGTYIRVGATTRRADRYRIEELILRGQHKFFDQELTDTFVKEQEAAEFCERLYEYAQANRSPESGGDLRKVSIGQLLSWGVIHEADHHFYASNGYLLLGGAQDKVPDAAIQCVVFKGTRRGTMLDRTEFNGTFYENIDNAMRYVMSCLEQPAPSGQLYPRSRLMKLDQSCLREIIANAVCHRSYQTPGKIQIAVFDDRIDIISPGGLDCSLAVEDIFRGRSRVRNPAMAHVFEYTGLFEGWGNGVPRLLQEMKDKGLPEPKFRARPGDFLVRIPAVEAEAETETAETTAQTDALPAFLPVVGLTEPTLDATRAASRRQPYEFVPYDEFTEARLTLSQEAGVPDTGAATERGSQTAQDVAAEPDDTEVDRVLYDRCPPASNLPNVRGRRRRGRSGRRRRDRRDAQENNGNSMVQADNESMQRDEVSPVQPSTAAAQLSQNETAVVEALTQNPELTQTELTTETGLSLTTVRRVLAKLIEKEIVAREGGRRYGSWVVKL